MDGSMTTMTWEGIRRRMKLSCLPMKSTIFDWMRVV
jgi:hypothetical protein